MTDPARLLDVGLDGSCCRALKAAMVDEPPPEAKAQLWRSITLALPAAGVLLGATTAASGVKAATVATSTNGAAGTVAAGTTTTVVGSSGLGLLAGKAVAIGLGIGLAVNVATGVGTRALASKPTASVAVPQPTVAAPVVRAKPSPAASPAPAATTELPEVAGQAIPIAPATAPSVSIEITNDELREESALLVRTREALNASNASKALELIGEHRQLFSGGRLVQERDALEVQALVKVGEPEQAQSRARAFLSRYPESPHAEKIRAIVDRP